MKRSITIVFLIVLIGVIGKFYLSDSKTIVKEEKLHAAQINEYESHLIDVGKNEYKKQSTINGEGYEENIIRIENENEVKVLDASITDTYSFNDNNIPITLRFPKRNIEAPIVPVGINDMGEMEVINDSVHISWYKYGHIPGGDGNAILSSHLDWKGKYGPLADLKRYPKGEILEIEFKDGSIKKFKLEQSNTYPVNFVPDSLMNVNGEERTTLITCSGAFKDGHYQDRVISIFKQID